MQITRQVNHNWNAGMQCFIIIRGTSNNDITDIP